MFGTIHGYYPTMNKYRLEIITRLIHQGSEAMEQREGKQPKEFRERA